MKKIIIYTKTGCPWCKEALEYLRESGVSFEERSVSENKMFFDELIEKTKQSKTPTLDIGGEILADTDAKAIAARFKELGIV